MPITKGEKAALNAVLKGLKVYDQFIKGKGCSEYKTCTFGFNNCICNKLFLCLHFNLNIILKRV